MLKQINSCENCELCKNRKKVKIGEGNISSNILIISEYPTEHLNKKIQEILNTLKINKSEFFITSSILCLTNKKPVITEKHLFSCFSNIYQIITEMNPEYVITLGSSAFKIITGKKDLSKYRGKIIKPSKDFKGFNFTVFPTYHPDYYYHNPEKEHFLFEDLASAFNYIKPPDHIEKILVDDMEKFEAMTAEIFEKETIAADTEGTGLHHIKNEIIGCSFSCDENRGYYVPLKYRLEKDSDLINFWEPPDDRYIKSTLKRIFESHIKKMFQNTPYDKKMIKYSIDSDLNTVVYDTMYADHIINENKKHDLDTLAKEYGDLIGYSKKMKNVVPKTVLDEGDYSKIPLELISDYACLDAITVYRTAKKTFNIIKDTKYEDLMYGSYLPYTEVIYNMETKGIQVDVDHLNYLKEWFTKDLNSIEQNIFELAGEHFNIRSGDQLGYVIFDKLKLPCLSRTKPSKTFPNGKKQLDKNVLGKLMEIHQLPAEVLKYRAVDKLLNTYVLRIEEEMVNGIFYPSFNQCGTVTGRLSSNLQNVSKGAKDEFELGLGKYRELIRPIFKAREGYRLVNIDYSQMELRLLGFYCRDENLLKILKGGGDLHAETAKTMFQKEEITSDDRRSAKTINFGIIYGLSPQSLCERLEISMSEAVQLIKDYDRKFSGINKWKNGVVYKDLAKNLYVENIFGRRRRYPNYRREEEWMQEKIRREAFNFFMQSTSGERVKIAQIECLKRQKEDHQLLQIHDEIMFEVKEDNVEKNTKILQEIMEEEVKPIDVPLPTDAEIQVNWGKPLNQE